jgi:hypothetical protein
MPLTGGSASEITAQDASDLLHKLISESTKVRAAFRSASGVTFTVVGTPKAAPEGEFSVQEGDRIGSAFIMCKPSLASVYRYGDDRAFSSSTGEKNVSFVSALTFVFPDDSQLTLFEIAQGRL